MRFATRFARALGIDTRDGEGGETAPGLPSRSDAPSLAAPGQALSISLVYRAMQIHTTAAMQLAPGVWRGNLAVEAPNWMTRPDTEMSLSAFIELTVMSLGLHGNAFWRIYRAASGEVARIQVLDPNECALVTDDARRVVGLSHRGARLRLAEFRHLSLMRVTSMPWGLGPIQACRVELAGALDLRDYASKWFRESDVPSGILATDKDISQQQAEHAKKSWRKARETRHREIAVLGGGLKYVPIMLSPADAQFLESQQFTATQIARLFGIPSSIGLISVESNSQTYANVEQDWIGYIRFALMRYLREIEEAFTSLLPHTRVARFKIDALLRTDTKSRYEAHKLGLEAGFLAVDEVRRMEGLDPLTAQETINDQA